MQFFHTDTITDFGAAGKILNRRGIVGPQAVNSHKYVGIVRLFKSIIIICLHRKLIIILLSLTFNLLKKR